jgi:hypothetical protein
MSIVLNRWSALAADIWRIAQHTERHQADGCTQRTPSSHPRGAHRITSVSWRRGLTIKSNSLMSGSTVCAYWMAQENRTPTGGALVFGFCKTASRRYCWICFQSLILYNRQSSGNKLTDTLLSSTWLSRGLRRSHHVDIVRSNDGSIFPRHSVRDVTATVASWCRCNLPIIVIDTRHDDATLMEFSLARQQRRSSVRVRRDSDLGVIVVCALDVDCRVSAASHWRHGFPLLVILFLSASNKLRAIQSQLQPDANLMRVESRVDNVGSCGVTRTGRSVWTSAGGAVQRRVSRYRSFDCISTYSCSRYDFILNFLRYGRSKGAHTAKLLRHWLRQLLKRINSNQSYCRSVRIMLIFYDA